MALGFAVLVLLTFKVYHEAPPIPDKVAGPDGSVVFSGDDIRSGQQVFLKYGLINNGTIWGHGAMLGPDFSAEYLHTLALHGATSLAQQRYGLTPDKLTSAQRAIVEAEVRIELKQNRYDPETGVLAVGPAYGDWFRISRGYGRSTFPRRLKTAVSAPKPSVIRLNLSSSVHSSRGRRGHRSPTVPAPPIPTPTTFPTIPWRATRRLQTRYCGAR